MTPEMPKKKYNKEMPVYNGHLVEQCVCKQYNIEIKYGKTIWHRKKVWKNKTYGKISMTREMPKKKYNKEMPVYNGHLV